jgi:hypothetical protein
MENLFSPWKAPKTRTCFLKRWNTRIPFPGSLSPRAGDLVSVFPRGRRIRLSVLYRMENWIFFLPGVENQDFSSLVEGEPLGLFSRDSRIISPRWLFSKGLENKNPLSPTGEEPESDFPAEN